MRPDFPVSAGNYVHGIAQEFGHEAARTVEEIRDFLGGNPGRMQELADGWNAIEAVLTQQTDIEQGNVELAGTWEGAAFESFDRYVGTVAGAMDSTSNAMGEMSVLLSDMIVKINETFQALIDLVADCARDLLETVTDLNEAILGGLTGGRSLMLAAIRVLGQFVTNAAKLVGTAMTTVAEYQHAAQNIEINIRKVKVPQPMSASAGPAGEWAPVNLS